MSTRRILALFVVLALSFALLSATASSARQAHVSVTDQGTVPPTAFKEDGGDDDRWGNEDPYDPEDPDPEGEGEGDDGDEPEGGEVQGGNPKAFETIRMQLANLLWHLRFMLAAF